MYNHKSCLHMNLFLFKKNLLNFFIILFIFWFLYHFLYLFLIIGLNLPENGDEGLYLRLIDHIIDGKRYLKDFISPTPTVFLYLFYPIDFFSDNYFLASRIFVAVISFFTFIILLFGLLKNDFFLSICILILFSLLIITDHELAYYPFEVRQWPFIFLFQTLLVTCFYFYFKTYKIIHIFTIGLLLGFLISTRQIYSLVSPILFVSLFLLELKELNLKIFIKKYLYFFIGFIISSFYFFSIFFLEIDFALNLWFLIDQKEHFAREQFSVYNSLKLFFGLKNKFVEPIIAVSIIIYFYLIYEMIFFKNRFNVICFIFTTLVIFLNFYGWSQSYHREVFFILLTYLILSDNKKKFYPILISLGVAVLLYYYNYILNNNPYLKSNLLHFKRLEMSYNNNNFGKIDLYGYLNKELNNYCNEDILAWDTRRGRLLSSNKKCKFHPKNNYDWFSTEFNQDVYSKSTVSKIFEIELKPIELVSKILFDLNLIIASDLDDFVQTIMLTIKRKALYDVLFYKLCDKNCNLMNTNYSYKIENLEKIIRNHILVYFNIEKKGDYTFFVRK